MAKKSSAPSDLASSPFVNWSSDECRQHLLFDIARRFKGIDPAVDAKIDAHAERISGKAGIKMIPGTFKGEPKVPFYLEGEPGVGKTTLIRAAIKEFCEVAELNFVENPTDGHQFTPKDFYYFTVNLSGKNSPMDIGGLPSKGEYTPGMGAISRSNNAGDWLLAEVASRARGMSALAKVASAEPTEYMKGSLRAVDLVLKGEPAQLDLLVNTLIRQVIEDAKKIGGGVSMLRDGDEAVDGRLQIQVKKGTNAIRLTTYAPVKADASVEYVAEMLPNRRFAMATKTPFSLVNFDDVANASESVRNVLLEVAQSNRYSGVMDIGNAMVTFTGNMGSEDNTNTQSEQSDAEVTRVFKVRVRDTPRDWAQRVASKYAETGDALFSAFIGKYGNEDGIFREPVGDGRSARGIPKPNSRSLENAMAKVLPYFVMARESNASPTIFAEEIGHVVKGTAGGVLAERYVGFMRAMLTDAIPLADELMATGDLNQVKFDANIGNETKASEQDFSFRFGAALADSFFERISLSPAALEAKGKSEAAYEAHLRESTDRLCTGLANLAAGNMNYTLSRVMTRMGAINTLGSYDGIEVKLNRGVVEALALGFADSTGRGIWNNPDQARDDFVAMVVGNRDDMPSLNKKAKAKA
ncbi:ATP-binding protein [Hydrogenophaga sp. 2FB]|uniref:ATP-binding protein n=1 Tax=Hydrogenophaga sp. 2FB TaxID=2502187 RepID=UPI0010F4992A|nr:ATP-binding protein [Hydrogenophaga sp. 2FB]